MTLMVAALVLKVHDLALALMVCYLVLALKVQDLALALMVAALVSALKFWL